MRNESPHHRLVAWSPSQKAGLIVVAVLVALITSWQWLGEPNLKVGSPAPFEARAPRDALVEDSQALQQKRSDLVPRTFVQVIDQQQSMALMQKLERQLGEIELVALSSEGDRIGPVNLNLQEQKWLSQRTQEARNIWEIKIREGAERMLSQGLVNTLAKEQLLKAVSMQLWDIGAPESPSRTLGSKLLASTFQGTSNLRTDAIKSQKLLEDLITKQGIPIIEVNEGDLITRQGERISPQAYDVLDYFGMIKRSPRPLTWFWKYSEALLGCFLLILIMRREKPALQARHALLPLLLLLVAQASKVWFGAAVSPLAVIVPPTLLISQGLGTSCALIWMAIGSLLWPVPVSGFGDGRMLVACAVAFLVALQAGRLRSRAQLFQLAVLLPLGALFAEWFLLASQINPANTAWGRLAPNSEALFSEAILMGALLMFAITLIPLIENAFGLVTRARLMELADQERPLLRKLSIEAPGTFEHTLMLCGLAEEGARSIYADVDLTRTGALYHDIGKLHAPEWFIENQENGINPHEELNDPLASASILQAHVDEGLKLAKKYRLPQSVVDFIPAHQGTMKMGYFLHLAKEKNPEIPESNFRYKGPLPRSKETAILMLADGCEAALRSLDQNIDDSDASETVRRIVESRYYDGQLIESGLTRAEIELVIRSFVRVWRRMKHRRIVYPLPAKNIYRNN
ncbi:HDIG domain-containing metalloprotein [Prochlorococcus sp. MIT 1341]|uniref:HDIG domain-containing metalloprotein n=1 Tax=Prochlorococcus sp. MIT 1341 TaxID=3096221 RepID=UPI002A75A786|nr:HDIG domain-containing metalloprotein [Prochlorococcus sp. MIT 1341]